MGGFEATDYSKAVGRGNRFGDVPRDDTLDALPPLKNFQRSPSCLVAGPSLYDGKIVPRADKGRTSLKAAPLGTGGARR